MQKTSSARQTPTDKESINDTCARAIRLEVTRIKLYERNPRRSKNPEYERIKASILATGMDQPLRVTMRPGDDQYIVQAGGNTRLQILKECWDATGDPRFLWVDCQFVEWECESSVLLAHLRENSLRGDLTFIDRAQAVFDVRSLLSEELGVSDIASRHLETMLKEHGYSVSYGLLSQMGYAVAVLLPLMPAALQSGVGKLQVRRIRNLERIARDIWKQRTIGAVGEFDEVFAALCRRHDSVDWQYDQLQQAIEVEIAEAADVGIQLIRMEFECRLSGRELEIPEFVEQEDCVEQDFPVSLRDEPAVPSEAEIQAETIAGRVVVARVPDAGESEGPSEPPLDVAIEFPLEERNREWFGQIGAKNRGLIPMELLRSRACKLAQGLAARHGLGELIAPVIDNGLGYVVRDIPSPSVNDQLDDDMLAQVTTMWWQLSAFAEMNTAPVELLVTLLDETSVLCGMLQATCAKDLVNTVWTVHPGYMAYRFWRQLSHEDWLDWLALAHNYRELHRMARRLNTPLWRSVT
ncbi:MAG: ParB family protein [Woeseia sp.]